ncbi:alpha-L-fucosidase [Streptomyces microflavus]|uniref:alpha-L-fucosidase n=1 Tax=Streptomyces TaxID=1883 RepID=UPI000C039A6B|nr:MULTISPECIES: alpha-L-fucosidase [Streptomyces]MCX4655983.1 alpha-L-fucosidase [Streptomyces microflavus]WSA64061.1 alpha-L-fucosidase [Streptomyces microflavus]WSS33262.1 alpha-L-fucosidase [Streptomyces microflavus]WST18205.1 alpha-L-fucosidase [Streptomyces microflavus]
MVASWWSRARLGIFVHWTPASVPGWAPPYVPPSELPAAGRRAPLGWTSYAEWYENSLRFPGSPAAAHHRATYGTRPYTDFGHDFEDGLSGWDPAAWARSFREAGAGYAVLVTKHHDGFCLWPSETENPHRTGWHTARDVVGEFAEAVRAEGLRFGVYYSGGLDWTFDDRPIGTAADMFSAVPRGRYPAYADAQLRELIRRYRPDILWNDIAWPAAATGIRSLTDFYRFTVPHGVVNDRLLPYAPHWRALGLPGAKSLYNWWDRRTVAQGEGFVPRTPPDFDFRTPEYARYTGSDPYEITRGIDHSFGYNRNSGPDAFIDRRALTSLVRDTAADGGNLLLNVGPRGEDATIPAEQQLRLDWLAEETASGSLTPERTPGRSAPE